MLGGCSDVGKDKEREGKWGRSTREKEIGRERGEIGEEEKEGKRERERGRK
jgi:hypothetical protein